VGGLGYCTGLLKGVELSKWKKLEKEWAKKDKKNGKPKWKKNSKSS